MKATGPMLDPSSPSPWLSWALEKAVKATKATKAVRRGYCIVIEESKRMGEARQLSAGQGSSMLDPRNKTWWPLLQSDPTAVSSSTARPRPPALHESVRIVAKGANY